MNFIKKGCDPGFAPLFPMALNGKTMRLIANGEQKMKCRVMTIKQKRGLIRKKNALDLWQYRSLEVLCPILAEQSWQL